MVSLRLGRTEGTSAHLLPVQPVLLDQGEVLVDEVLAHPGEEGELLKGELGCQQADPLEARM